ncbi:BglG family transcription antiterminator LicT [Clostridium diolis]|uniref:Transcription antiterminator LicT n=1 Tax=Clostridium diolis TaxID=223919 RepID=A0AAV3W763_9CLOT|nr:PRD domain-containing protein [Clostridium diolis]QES73426.1 PRD domain-containing protein [Clostridium diolis]GEA32814.1 transcription antiterminator LicT [Clostridium diolis]
MVIKKILNNNVVITENDSGKEIIVMGAGLAFKSKKGDIIPEEKIDKIFTLSDNEAKQKLQLILSEIPLEYVEVTEKIINNAKEKLGKKLNDTLYITLTDHIYSSVERYNEGLPLKNALLWDTKRFYKEEFTIGMECLQIIKDKFNVDMQEDEAASIALHIVNAQMNEDMTILYDITKIMQEITNIVKYHFNIIFNEESLAYYRFITHLKFFAQRLLKENDYRDDNDSELFETVKKKYKDAYECTKKIDKFILEKYNYKLADEELLYLTIHITKVIKNS